jgi:hypothetical protein
MTLCDRQARCALGADRRGRDNAPLTKRFDKKRLLRAKNSWSRQSRRRIGPRGKLKRGLRSTVAFNTRFANIDALGRALVGGQIAQEGEHPRACAYLL